MAIQMNEGTTVVERSRWSEGRAAATAETCEAGIATVVRGPERVAFLGRLVGLFKFTLERTVVRAMTELAGCAALGTWEFVALRDGGGYLRPADRTYILEAPNYMTARVSADVAGIVATLYAFAELRASYRAEGIFATRYAQLHAFAAKHAHAGVIFRLFEL